VAVSGLGASDDALAAFTKAVDAGDKSAQAKAQSDNDAAKTQIAAGWALTGIGAAALVAGVVMIAIPAKKPATQTSFGVGPWIGPAGPTGLTLYGTY